MTGKTRYLALLLPLCTFAVWAQDAAVQIMPAGSQSAVYGVPAHFTGQVRVEPLFPAGADIAASGAYVTFEPGARSAWHTHPAGQLHQVAQVLHALGEEDTAARVEQALQQMLTGAKSC